MTETTAAGVLRSLLATAASAGLATALTYAAWRRVAALPNSPLRVEDAVAAIVVAGGAAATAVLAAGSGLLLLGAVARLTGRTWRWCDRAAARVTPAVLRRAIAVTVTTGLGVTAAAGAAGASEIDLGWVPTENATQTDGQGRHPDDPVREEHQDHQDHQEPTVTELAHPAEADAGAPETSSLLIDPTSTEPEPDGPPDPARGATSDAVPSVTDHRAPSPGPPEHRPDTPGAAAPPERHPADRVEVVVTAGDSLWSIARAHLSDPSDADVAAHWPQWYAANRAVVGADPDLIHPGQILLAPEADTTPEETAR